MDVRIKMTKTTPVALDGIHTRLYSKDVEYTMPNDVADMLVKSGAAKRVEAEIVRRRAEPPKPEVASTPEPSEKKDEDVDVSDDSEKTEDTGKRVHEFAKDLKTTNRTILNKAAELGIGATTPASKLTTEEMDRIKKVLGVE